MLGFHLCGFPPHPSRLTPCHLPLKGKATPSVALSATAPSGREPFGRLPCCNTEQRGDCRASLANSFLQAAAAAAQLAQKPERRLCDGLLPLEAEIQSNPEQPEPPRICSRVVQPHKGKRGSGGNMVYIYPGGFAPLSTRESGFLLRLYSIPQMGIHKNAHNRMNCCERQTQYGRCTVAGSF